MTQSWLLVVKTQHSDALDLTYRDRALLVDQLAFFRANGLSDRHYLHEFRNECGSLLAFISKAYISHSVQPDIDAE
ncbi:MAG TPA: hypothetical protein VMD91_15190 [Candidatus Sulfotelmatobacter sp.]|nr:hypothetical protein [Candidatus Sulfotelmatobacter sp.]